MTTRILVWGAEPAEFANWPSELDPMLVEALPSDAVVVVPLAAAEAFRAHVDALSTPDGVMPEAVLLLPPGGAPGNGDWAYFDADVVEGDWGELARLAGQDGGFHAADLAHHLSSQFLISLDRPIEQIATDDLPLGEEARAYLAQSTIRRELFDRAVWERQFLRRAVNCPSVDALAAVARGQRAPTVAEHVRTCQTCTGTLTALERVIRPVLIDAALPASSTTERLETSLSWVASLIGGFFRAQFVPAYDPTVVSLTSASAPTSVERALRTLQRDGQLHLAGAAGSVQCSIDSRTGALIIGGVRDDLRRSVPEFELQLSRDQDVILSRLSAGGQVQVTADEIEGAIASGAQRLRITRATAEGA